MPGSPNKSHGRPRRAPPLALRTIEGHTDGAPYAKKQVRPSPKVPLPPARRGHDERPFSCCCQAKAWPWDQGEEGRSARRRGENAVRLAVLIDADNARPSNVAGLLAEVAKYGTADVKRAYGHQLQRLEGSPARPVDPAVRLHHREKRHRRRDGHRRDGPVLLGPLRRLSASFPATSPSSPHACANPAPPATDSAIRDPTWASAIGPPETSSAGQGCLVSWCADRIFVCFPSGTFWMSARPLKLLDPTTPTKIHCGIAAVRLG
ncbi:hypothetical protein A4R44_08066 [Amycolatopsis sp. M39]|nr:hypothetical protein A4R44_08066 [Amycolatopsis sp. M39]